MMDKPFLRTTAVEFLRSDAANPNPAPRDWTKPEAYREQVKRDAR